MKSTGPSTLSVDEIRKNIVNKSLQNIDILEYETTDSTNTRAKIYAENSTVCTKAVFIAKEQTAGRGRLGKNFDSKGGGGLYISFLFKEKKELSPALITAESAVKVCSVLEELSSVRCEIKWVNDIYSSGKKLSGILCEGKTDSLGALSYYVVGIGINLYSRPFPEEIKNIATSVEDITGERVNINALVGKLIDSFFSPDKDASFMNEYRRRSCLIGRKINVRRLSGEVFDATVLDITEDAALLVEKADRTREALISAEVSTQAI